MAGKPVRRFVGGDFLQGRGQVTLNSEPPGQLPWGHAECLSTAAGEGTKEGWADEEPSAAGPWRGCRWLITEAPAAGQGLGGPGLRVQEAGASRAVVSPDRERDISRPDAGDGDTHALSTLGRSPWPMSRTGPPVWFRACAVRASQPLRPLPTRVSPGLPGGLGLQEGF